MKKDPYFYYQVYGTQKKILITLGPLASKLSQNDSIS